MYDLVSKVLMVDDVPVDNIARYEWTSSTKDALIFYPEQNKIVNKTGYEEVVVPLTTDDVNWDDFLIQMLIKSVDKSDSTRNLTTTSFDNHDTWLDVSSFFEENKLICYQVVVHPSCDIHMPCVHMPSINVHKSDLCPKNSAFFLAPPHFMGVFARKKSSQEFGMGILNPHFIVRVNLV